MGIFINLFLSQIAVLNSEIQRAVLRIQVDRRERSVLAQVPSAYYYTILDTVCREKVFCS